jgi:hypothetical protein
LTEPGDLFSLARVPDESQQPFAWSGDADLDVLACLRVFAGELPFRQSHHSACWHVKIRAARSDMVADVRAARVADVGRFMAGRRLLADRHAGSQPAMDTGGLSKLS